MKSLLVRVCIIIIMLCCLSPLCGQQHGSVVLCDSTSVTVSSGDYYTCLRHTEVMLMDAQSASLANVVIRMDKNTELTRLEYEMRSPDGKVLRTLHQRNLQRVEYSPDLANDYYCLVAEVTPPTFPVIISQRVRTARRGNILSFPAFYPQPRYDMAVRHAAYDISWPSDKVVMRRYAHSIADSLLQVTTEGKKQRLLIALDDLPAVKRLPYAPRLDDLVPFALFAPERIAYYNTTGSMASWQDLGAWIGGLCADRQFLDEATRQRVAEAIAHCTDDRQKVAALYAILAHDMRYVSLQLGIGGYQPFEAAAVSQMGFGDCKGLSNYLYALLKEAGIESHLVVIGTDEPRLYPDFANFQQIDHMLLMALLHNRDDASRRDTLWIECTNAKLPLGYIHDSVSGHQALMVRPDGGSIVTLPEYADTLNVSRTQVSLALQADASAHISIDAIHCNHRYGQQRGLLLLNEQDLRTHLASAYALPNAETGEVWVTDHSQPFGTPQLATHLTADSRRYANRSGRRLFVPLNPLHKGYSPQNVAEADSQRLVIVQGSLTEEHIQLLISEGYHLESLPTDIDLHDSFMSFQQHAYLEDRTLHLVLRHQVHSGSFPASARARMADMQRQMAKAYAAKVVLVED